MRIDIITLQPALLESPFNHSMIQRAKDKGFVTINIINLRDYAIKAKARGIKVIIAGAGGAAHLPGMVAANTILPVIGVPVKSSNSIDGWDSMLSILQMPYGVPVATVALNGAKNAGILAAQILALHDTSIAGKLEAYKEYQDDIVMESVKNVKHLGYTNQFDK